MLSGSQEFDRGDLQEESLAEHAAENKLASAIVSFLNEDVKLVIDDQYFISRKQQHSDYDYITRQIDITLKHANDLKNAALILFDLVRKLALCKQDIIEAHLHILNTMMNSDLTLKHKNKIFTYLLGRVELVNVISQAEAPVQAPYTQKNGLFAMASGITTNLRQYAVSTLSSASGGLYSPEWQDTMRKSRHFALKKLHVELESLLDEYDKIKYLEGATRMPIFCEHQSNSVLTGGYGNTHAVTVINKMLQDLRDSQSLSKSMTKLN